jgi:hypothetical protein
MKAKRHRLLDFIVDKLTNSIQNTISGDTFQTDVFRFTLDDVKLVAKKTGWNFDWKSELNDNKKEVYKLTIQNNSGIIQGLLSITI